MRLSYVFLPFFVAVAGSVCVAQVSSQDAVTALEEGLAKACVAADCKPYEESLSEDFRGINADGSVEKKKEYTDDIRNGIFKCSKYTFRETQCQIAGDVVIFHALVRQKATWNGVDCSGDYQMTDV